MKFFGLEMTPPIWTFFPNFTTKIYCFETNKICDVIFLIKNDPPPHFGLKKKQKQILVDGHPLFLDAVLMEILVNIGKYDKT